MLTRLIDRDLYAHFNIERYIWAKKDSTIWMLYRYIICGFKNEIKYLWNFESHIFLNHDLWIITIRRRMSHCCTLANYKPSVWLTYYLLLYVYIFFEGWQTCKVKIINVLWSNSIKCGVTTSIAIWDVIDIEPLTNLLFNKSKTLIIYS